VSNVELRSNEYRKSSPCPRGLVLLSILKAIQFPEPVRQRTLSGNSTDRRIRRECLDRVSSDLHRSRSRFQAIGSGYRSRLCRISSHLISSIRVRLNTRFSDSTSPKNASKRSQRSTEKGKQFVSQRAGESSVAVGMTRQLLGPLAATRRLIAGMSPESRHPNLSQSENQR
jgi:hypothetical protein